MKKFLIQIMIFIIPMVILPFGADIFISKNLRKSNNYADGEYPTWNDLYNGTINSDIVVYGSSRAWVHVNPSMISDSLNTAAYNLGINGHGFWLQYFRHSIFLKYNRKPKLIIQTLDATTLGRGPDLYNPDQFLPYMLHNEEMKRATIIYNGYSSYDYEIPFVRYFGKKEAIIKTLNILVNPSSNKVKRIRGYQGMDEQWNDDLLMAQQEMDSYKAKIDTSLISLFIRFINECKQNNIELIFVYSPEYIEGQEFVSNRSEILALYYEFSQKYDIPFFDYSKDTISYQKKYFYNSGHMNIVGAELFTSKLIADLKKYKEIIGF